MNPIPSIGSISSIHPIHPSRLIHLIGPIGPVLWRSLCPLVLAPLATGAAAGGTPARPIPPVPKGHPRVYLRAADIPELRRKVQLAEFAEAWDLVRNSKRPVCRAFTFLMTGDRETGRKAVEGSLNWLKADKDNMGKRKGAGRPFNNPMHQAACVYDWCYPLLTAAEKQAFIKEFKQFFADDHGRGYPPNAGKLNPIQSHDSEGCIMSNLLPAGLAVYDEERELYELAARIFLDIYVDVRDFYYQAHAHHQGTGYANERFQHDQTTSWLLRKMGAGDVLSREQQYVPYHQMYAACSDGRLLAMGDCSQHLKYRGIERATAAYYGDPYLLTWSDGLEYVPWEKEKGALWLDLLYLPPNARRAPLTDLPLTKYFPPPMGEMIARTGWNMTRESGDAVVHMRIGEHYFGNHQHRDWGTFQIYYRGMLTGDTGAYHLGNKDTGYGAPHWREYYQQTVAHNGLMIFDPATAQDDFGGQRKPKSSHPKPLGEIQKNYHWGRVTAHGAGPDPVRPTYSYLAGDITGAYFECKAGRVTRSMVAFNTGNAAYPVVFVVFDDVVATQPGFKKAWYLHALKEPQVDGRTTTIINDLKMDKTHDFGGQLVVNTLLPAEARIVKVGGPGKECWNEATQKNYPATAGAQYSWPREELVGAWRIEVMPGRPSKQDHFLNVLTVMDKGAPPPAVTPLRGAGLAGARALDCAVLFNETAAPLTAAAFDIPGEQPAALLVCGLAPGTWQVAGPRAGTAARVTEQARCLFFRAEPGAYRLERSP
ncbi:MAG: heparinase II/III family protein [Kiritimatiellae bacterium]|nr:heparinase II/III family protein [Kiritimatiellia bacterium]